jgi:hypothetical protein
MRIVLLRLLTAAYGTNLPSIDVRSTTASEGNSDIEPPPPEGRG